MYVMIVIERDCGHPYDLKLFKNFEDQVLASTFDSFLY